GQYERPSAALEQRALQSFFERLDLMAHRRWRHAELRGRSLEAQVACRSAECPQAANRAFAQRRSSYRKLPSRFFARSMPLDVTARRAHAAAPGHAMLRSQRVVGDRELPFERARARRRAPRRRALAFSGGSRARDAADRMQAAARDARSQTRMPRRP